MRFFISLLVTAEWASFNNVSDQRLIRLLVMQPQDPR